MLSTGDMRSAASVKQERIRTLNDQFRAGLGTGFGIAGMVATTAGIAGLTDDQKAEILMKVREFDDFTPDNDPYGEHDFGSFDVEGVGKVFWKIDYYADNRMESGAEDPADPTQSFWSLMVMFSHEY